MWAFVCRKSISGSQVKEPLAKHFNIRQRFSGMQTPHVAGFLEVAAFFGVELGQDQDVLRVAYNYLEDYVNDVNERDAIRVVVNSILLPNEY